MTAFFFWVAFVKIVIVYKRKKFLIYAGLLIGLGLGVRIQFFALLIPLFLFVFLYKFYDKKFSLGLFVLDSFLIIIISYLEMIIIKYE